jgi:formyltetrahydrofolate synthetase
MHSIARIAEALGIDPKYVEQYGNYKAKIDYTCFATFRADRMASSSS